MWNNLNKGRVFSKLSKNCGLDKKTIKLYYEIHKWAKSAKTPGDNKVFHLSKNVEGKDTLDMLNVSLNSGKSRYEIIYVDYARMLLIRKLAGFTVTQSVRIVGELQLISS
jgi:hypothetical protein